MLLTAVPTIFEWSVSVTDFQLDCKEILHASGSHACAMRSRHQTATRHPLFVLVYRQVMIRRNGDQL